MESAAAYVYDGQSVILGGYLDLCQKAYAFALFDRIALYGLSAAYALLGLYKLEHVNPAGVKRFVSRIHPHARARACVVGVLYAHLVGRLVPAKEGLCGNVRLWSGQLVSLSVSYFKRSFAHRSPCNDKRNRVFLRCPVRVQRQVLRFFKLCPCVRHSVARLHPVVEVVAHQRYFVGGKLQRVVLRAVKRCVALVSLYVVPERHFIRSNIYSRPFRRFSCLVIVADFYYVRSFFVKAYLVPCRRAQNLDRIFAVYSHCVLARSEYCRPFQISLVVFYFPFQRSGKLRHVGVQRIFRLRRSVCTHAYLHVRPIYSVGQLHAAACLHKMLHTVYTYRVAHRSRDGSPFQRRSVYLYASLGRCCKPCLCICVFSYLRAVVAVRHRAHSDHDCSRCHFLQRHRSVVSYPLAVVYLVLVILRVGYVVPDYRLVLGFHAQSRYFVKMSLEYVFLRFARYVPFSYRLDYKHNPFFRHFAQRKVYFSACRLHVGKAHLVLVARVSAFDRHKVLFRIQHLVELQHKSVHLKHRHP